MLEKAKAKLKAFINLNFNLSFSSWINVCLGARLCMWVVGANGCPKKVSNPLLPRDTGSCELPGMCSEHQTPDKDINDSELLSHLSSQF